MRDEGQVKIWELIGSGDSARIEAMLGLYARLFPQYAYYAPRMRRRAVFGEERRTGHIVHYWLVEANGQPVGIRTFRYVRERHCGIAVALAIDPIYRDIVINEQRLSLFLIRTCLDQIIEDAQRLGDPPPFGMINEVEYPRLMEHYKRYGIVELPVKYIEPVFPPDVERQSRVEEIKLLHFIPTSLGILPNPALNRHAYSKENVADFALAFLVDHYGLPVDHPQVQSVLDSILMISQEN